MIVDCRWPLAWALFGRPFRAEYKYAPVSSRRYGMLSPGQRVADGGGRVRGSWALKGKWRYR